MKTCTRHCYGVTILNILPIFPGKVSAIGNKNRLTSEYRSKMLEKGKAPPESKEADAVNKNIGIGAKSKLDAVTGNGNEKFNCLI